MLSPKITSNAKDQDFGVFAIWCEDVTDPASRRLLISYAMRRCLRHQTRAQMPALPSNVIGHIKAEGHLGCCYLKSKVDAVNAILAAIGYILASPRPAEDSDPDGPTASTRSSARGQIGFLTSDYL
jgi:hypothetical protein